MFRDSESLSQPVIQKAATSNALDTLVAEAQRTIGQSEEVAIFSTGVGPVTEEDLNNAEQFGAVILGFGVPAGAA